VATVRHKKPENWLGAVTRNGHGMVSEDALPARDLAIEALLMGLRLREGVDLGRIAARSGVPEPVNPSAVARLAALGLVEIAPPRLTVTERGFGLLDAILTEVVAN
jgi:oxygen-independent coproporphyrinogen-3 oxidase